LTTASPKPFPFLFAHVPILDISDKGNILRPHNKWIPQHTCISFFATVGPCCERTAITHPALWIALYLTGHLGLLVHRSARAQPRGQRVTLCNFDIDLSSKKYETERNSGMMWKDEAF
jgi:hypothetical protein